MLATILAYGVLISSALGFVLTVLDRILCKVGKGFRIHEYGLFAITCLLGGVGVMLGMFMAQKDVYKPELRLGVPAIALGEVLLLFMMVPGFWEAIKAVFAR